MCNSDESLDAESTTYCKRFPKSLRTSKPPRNPDKLLFEHLNTNSIRNKSEILSYQVKGNIDVLMVSDTKLMIVSFPNENILLDELRTP